MVKKSASRSIPAFLTRVCSGDWHSAAEPQKPGILGFPRTCTDGPAGRLYDVLPSPKTLLRKRRVFGLLVWGGDARSCCLPPLRADYHSSRSVPCSWRGLKPLPPYELPRLSIPSPLGALKPCLLKTLKRSRF